MGFDPNEPRDAMGRWTDSSGTATHLAASDSVKNLMAKAKEAAPELDEEAKKVAELVGGTATGINLKSEERIKEKAAKEYGGDVSKVKDAVRTTIVADYSKLEAAAEALKNIPGITRVKIQDGDEFFGYKGVLANYKTKNGITAEIQVNSPGMLYAKEAKKDNTKFLSDKQYAEIKAKTGLEGGLGHVYYEQIRSTKDRELKPEEQKKVEGLIQKSKQYYSNFYGF